MAKREGNWDARVPPENRRRRWTFHFLHELVFSGDARLSAEWVGADHGEVWMRRLKEPKFAGLWDAAMRLNAQLEAAAQARLRGLLRQPFGLPPPQQS